MFVVELVLSTAEMAVVLDALRLSSLIGMPKDAFSYPPAEGKAVRAAGLQSLTTRKLASRGADGVVALDADLAAIVKVAADANQAALIVKDIPGTGRQLFVHGAFNNAVVEHTRPAEGAHRLAVLQSQQALPARWAQILPLPAAEREESLGCALGTFERAVKLVNQGQREGACTLLSEAGPSAAVERLVRTMAHPSYSANIALLWREKGKIQRARNPLLVVGGQFAWLAHQDAPGSTRLVIRRVGQELALAFIVDQWKAVASRGS
jgi:hypothetical protein